MVYENYLLSYEEMAVQGSVHDIVSRWCMNPTGGPEQYPEGAELAHWLTVLSFSKEEIAVRRVPKDLVDTLGFWRPIFHHLLRNLQETRARHIRAMRRTASIQAVDESPRYDYTEHGSAAVYNSKRHRSSSMDSDASPVATQAEKMLRIDANRYSYDEEAKYGGRPRAPLTKDTPPRQDYSIPQGDTGKRSVRKPTILARAPNADELRDAQLWMETYRQCVINAGPSVRDHCLSDTHRYCRVARAIEPPQIADAEWPTWHSLFVEVQQLISQLRPHLATVLCELSEKDAKTLVDDVRGLLSTLVGSC